MLPGQGDHGAECPYESKPPIFRAPDSLLMVEPRISPLCLENRPSMFPLRPRMRRPIAGLLALCAIAPSCGSDPLEVGAPETPVCAAGGIDGEELLLFSWPDYVPPESIAGFERLNGITVEIDTYESNEEMLSEIEARARDFDLIIPSEYMVDIMRRDNLLLPLDPIALPGRINLDPLFDNPPFDPDGNYSVPYLWGTIGIGVNVNVVDDRAAQSWGLIFDPEVASHFAGRISLLDEPRLAMAAALMYLGHSPNTRKLDDIVAAADLIEATVSNLAGFQSERYAEDLADGALDIAHGRSDVFFGAFDATSGDYRYVIPQEGALAWVETMAIPITAKNKCTAHAFIDFMLESRNAADAANYTSYASPNLEARQFIDDDLLTNPAIYPPEDAYASFEFLVDTGNMEIEYIQQFSRAQGS